METARILRSFQAKEREGSLISLQLLSLKDLDKAITTKQLISKMLKSKEFGAGGGRGSELADIFEWCLHSALHSDTLVEHYRSCNILVKLDRIRIFLHLLFCFEVTRKLQAIEDFKMRILSDTHMKHH